MNATIGKRFEFEAAHQIPNHAGKCARRHGHSYKVEVMVSGPVKAAAGASDDGMVVDFYVLSQAFRERVFDVCDHQDLNEVLPVEVTTAENIAGWILAEMQTALATVDVTVTGVRVWETASGFAEVRP